MNNFVVALLVAAVLGAVVATVMCLWLGKVWKPAPPAPRRPAAKKRPGESDAEFLDRVFGGKP